jgi:hypothetical protein
MGSQLPKFFSCPSNQPGFQYDMQCLFFKQKYDSTHCLTAVAVENAPCHCIKKNKESVDTGRSLFM